MRIAILGGSFNPFHNGHAMLADTVIKDLGYEKILLVPTCIPPHKKIAGGASTQQRMEMIQKFCNEEQSHCFEAELCEIQRSGISYTCDTLHYIIDKYKDQLEGKPALIIGEEIAAEFNKWKNPDEIVEMADLIIVSRNFDSFGHYAEGTVNKPLGDYQGEFKVKFNIQNFEYPCNYLKSSILPISSTDIRSRIVSNRSYKYLVPSSIYEYIEKNGLYK